MEELRERFDSYLIPGPGDCRDWNGTVNIDKWGRRRGEIRWVGVPSRIASRVAYWLEHGELPEEVRHTCDRPICCHAPHLIPGNHADNMRDMVERGRSRAKQTHCKHGHEYAVCGVRYGTRGNGTKFRICLECDRARTHARRGAEKPNHRGPRRKPLRD